MADLQEQLCRALQPGVKAAQACRLDDGAFVKIPKRVSSSQSSPEILRRRYAVVSDLPSGIAAGRRRPRPKRQHPLPEFLVQPVDHVRDRFAALAERIVIEKKIELTLVADDSSESITPTRIISARRFRRFQLGPSSQILPRPQGRRDRPGPQEVGARCPNHAPCVYRAKAQRRPA